jgi:hypothetical protein
VQSPFVPVPLKAAVEILPLIEVPEFSTTSPVRTAVLHSIGVAKPGMNIFVIPTFVPLMQLVGQPLFAGIVVPVGCVSSGEAEAAAGITAKATKAARAMQAAISLLFMCDTSFLRSSFPLDF